ncbi:TPA: hypothetical protein HA251_06760 [Candidatus Woesearchaeota archaeon]|nr:hypothetical protein [Candidatus Woesearchaeota archaeon]
MEMIGLVFIVVIIIIGMVLYLSLSGKDDSGARANRAANAQKSSSFLTAIAETDIVGCGVPLSRVAQACVRREVFCDNGDPCITLERAMTKIANETLYAQGMKYNLSLEGTRVQAESDCDSANLSVSLIAAPRQPIPLGNGQTVDLILSICR